MIIGKRGEQPFQITGANVSAQHAEFVIDSQTGVWTLKDLDSTNGTFIRDESTGDLRRIKTKVIHPLTFVCLGSDNSKGCTFYARQLLNPGNYNEELLYIRKKNKEFEERITKIDKTTQIINIFKVLLTILLLGLLIAPMLYSSEKPDMGWTLILRISASLIPSVIIQLFQIVYNPTKKKDNLRKMQACFSHCPNPMCNYKLQAEHIKSMDCPSCHGI